MLRGLTKSLPSWYWQQIYIYGGGGGVEMGDFQQYCHTVPFFSLYLLRFKRWRLIIFKRNINFVCKLVFFTSAINCVVLLFHPLGRLLESSPLHSCRGPFESSTHGLRTNVAWWLLTKRPRQLICWDQHMWTVNSDSSASEHRQPDVLRYHQS